MRVAITGGAGRLGRVLASRLPSETEVVIVDVAEQQGAGAADLSFRSANVTDFESTTAALEAVDAVVHLAAIPWDLPDEGPLVSEVNIQGTVNVLEACARQGIMRVVLASSISAVGMMFRRNPWEPSYFPTDESHPTTPDNMYGLSKLVNEQQGGMYSRRYGMTVACLRFAPVWFEEMNPFTQLCVAGAFTPEINVDKIWAYVSALDAADAIRLALESELPSLSIMNIGAAEVCSDELTSTKLVAKFYPQISDVRNTEAFSEEPFAPLWSIDRARQLLGYSPQVSWRDFASRLGPNVLEAARSGKVSAVRQEIYGHPEAQRRG